MLTRTFTPIMALFLLVLVAACNQEEAPRRYTAAPEVPAPAAAAPDPASAIATGPVVETMNSGGYTYVLVDAGDEQIWVAGPDSVVKVGDEVVIPQGDPIPGFSSKTLDRTFELIYFAREIQDTAGNSLSKSKGKPAGSSPMGGMPAGHGSTAGKSPPADVDLSGVEKAEGGKTVGEIYESKADLSNKEVTLRGKVVKFNANIMGRNWLHVRDGSGDEAAKTNDLTVTTDVTVNIGDTVLVTGEIHLDKDFGAGYKYGVIIEDAQVVVE